MGTKWEDEQLEKWLDQSRDENQALKGQVDTLEESNESLLQENEKLRELLSKVFSLSEEAPELNMLNYDEDQVTELNESMIRVYRTLLEKTKLFT